MSKIRGVIYDLDGTIISTTKLHNDAWKEAGRRHNVSIDEHFLKNQSGQTNEAAAKLALGGAFAKLSKSFVQVKHQYVMQNLGKAQLYQDFVTAYQQLTKRGTNTWICTSAPKDFVMLTFEALPELKILRNKTVWREMYAQGKPHPEPIQLTAKLMELPVESCVYVGDGYNDYLAATKAGCKFVYFCPNLKEKDARIDAQLISNHIEILNFI